MVHMASKWCTLDVLLISSYINLDLRAIQFDQSQHQISAQKDFLNMTVFCLRTLYYATMSLDRILIAREGK